MERLVLTPPDDLESRFRDAVYRRYDIKEWNLTRAVKETLEQWTTVVVQDVGR
jgi:hypothetical protein